VPGDVIEVPDDCQMPCDAVLLQGLCVMNESMLTGESTAVIKNSLDNTNDIYNPDDFDSAKRYTLYNGTKII